MMSDSCYHAVDIKQRVLLDVIDDAWEQDCLSDDEILIPKELDGDLEAFNEEDEDHSESWSDLGIDQMPHTDSSRTAAAKKMDKKDKPAIALPPQAFPQS